MKWLIVTIIAVVLQQFLPWWSIGIAAFVFGFLIEQSETKAFFHGFLGIFIYWGGIVTYIYFANDAILANRLAVLTGIPLGELTLPLTALIGAIPAGFASWTGRGLRKLINWEPAPIRES